MQECNACIMSYPSVGSSNLNLHSTSDCMLHKFGSGLKTSGVRKFYSIYIGCVHHPRGVSDLCYMHSHARSTIL